jgi:hypothetical protein
MWKRTKILRYIFGSAVGEYLKMTEDDKYILTRRTTEALGNLIPPPL